MNSPPPQAPRPLHTHTESFQAEKWQLATSNAKCISGETLTSNLMRVMGPWKMTPSSYQHRNLPECVTLLNQLTPIHPSTIHWTCYAHTPSIRNRTGLKVEIHGRPQTTHRAIEL